MDTVASLMVASGESLKIDPANKYKWHHYNHYTDNYTIGALIRNTQKALVHNLAKNIGLNSFLM